MAQITLSVSEVLTNYQPFSATSSIITEVPDSVPKAVTEASSKYKVFIFSNFLPNNCL